MEAAEILTQKHLEKRNRKHAEGSEQLLLVTGILCVQVHIAPL